MRQNRRRLKSKNNHVINSFMVAGTAGFELSASRNGDPPRAGGTLIGTNGKRCMCGRSNRVSGPVSIFLRGKPARRNRRKIILYSGILRIRCFVRLVT